MDLRIAQLANFVGPTSGGMKVAIDQLAQGYVDAGARRLLVIPGSTDDRIPTELGDVVTASDRSVAGRSPLRARNAQTTPTSTAAAIPRVRAVVRAGAQSLCWPAWLTTQPTARPAVVDSENGVSTSPGTAGAPTQPTPRR